MEGYRDSDIGIYSAALGRRDYDAPILFASIDSVYKRGGEFTPFDAIFVDEAHRIPPAGEGKYLTFLRECKRFNPKLRVIGWTATPYRMGVGTICHKDHLLHEVCYEAKVSDLIAQGYLCNLRSKVGEAIPDLSKVRKQRGEYVTASLAEAVSANQLISRAVAEIIRLIDKEERKAILIFCVDIAHCVAVSQELLRYGIFAPPITSKATGKSREETAENFKNGRLRAVCNVNVYTEGFDAQRIDCIVLLRPTLSSGLFYQMVGRGLRLFPGKRYCLILDFAGCIDQHGPIDCLGGSPIVMAVCGRCRESFSRAVRRCPQCGWEIPKQEIDRLETAERKRRMHGDKASNREILSGIPETCKVDDVYTSRYSKPGSPDSLLVRYRCGLRVFREWICLDHEGFAGQKAAQWWRKRFGSWKPQTVNAALEDLLLVSSLKEWTQTITVRKLEKYWEIVGYNQPI